MLSFINRVSSRSSKTDVTTKGAETADPDTAQPAQSSDTAPQAPTDAPQPEALATADARVSVSIYSTDGVQDARTDNAAMSSAALSIVPATQVSHEPATELKRTTLTADKPRRLSWRPLSFKFLNNQDTDEHKHTLSHDKEQKKKLQAAEDKAKRAARVSSADKKAKESAVIVRSLIIGPSGISIPSAKTKPISKPKIAKVKAQLLNPKSASRVIAQLRALPSTIETLPGHGTEEHTAPSTTVPIHAVCLPYTDPDADTHHFTKLKADANASGDAEVSINATSTAHVVASVYNTSVSQLETLFSDMEIVSLFTAPNFGLGEGGDGKGIFSGALPTARTVIDGVEQITPQLLALGYATGKSILPDHTGIHPPTDRMSLLTYWWGFEVALPPPSIQYLSNVPSIAHTVINILTALSAIDGGVREILPFVRYIAQYIDAEFNMIKQQDHGKGVVCAATWLVPFALVARPWDFTPAPTVIVQPAPADDPAQHAPQSADPSSPPLSPSLPPSRPVSPPSLLPPLPIHESGFGETKDEPAQALPIDETPIDIDDATITQSVVPSVAIVPPTPTASGIRAREPEAASPEA